MRDPSPTSQLTDIPRNTILVGDALAQLRRLPPDSVDCCITSPPYHLLRRYGGGPDELGAETHVDAYVARLVEILDEVGRTLKPTASLWLSLGDSYSRQPKYGAPAKSLLLAPERVLLKLVARVWRLRNKVIWHKPNAMPNSVRDRLSSTWEPLFHLVRRRDYAYDLDAIREPHRSRPLRRGVPPPQRGAPRPEYAGVLAGSNDGLQRARAEGRVGHPLGRNPADVWTIATAGYRGAHPAVYPERLIERPIRLCPERVCGACGRPWRRDARRDRLGDLRPSCGCRARWVRSLVLDPFIGSGTTAVVARRLGRDYLGIELNPGFVRLAEERIASAEPERLAA